MEEIIFIINNLVFGMLFEVLFIYLIIIIAKRIKNKKLLLFFIVFLGYIISGIIVNFTYDNQAWAITLMIIFIFLVCKLLYKDNIEILDIFLITFSIFVVSLVSALSLSIFGFDKIEALIFSRLVLLFVIDLLMLFDFYKLYALYVSLWNRRDDGNIKSITIRNISVIMLNVTMFLITFFVNYFLS